MSYAGRCGWGGNHGSGCNSKVPLAQRLTITAPKMSPSEQGRVDLHAPAGDYLRTFRLMSLQADFGPTVCHLLTRTAGVGYWRRRSDWSLRAGARSDVLTSRQSAE
jgi:hypothetical protein